MECIAITPVPQVMVSGDDTSQRTIFSKFSVLGSWPVNTENDDVTMVKYFFASVVCCDIIKGSKSIVNWYELSINTVYIQQSLSNDKTIDWC